MKTAAIIAEYNPFHNGHLYHVEETRKKGYDHIIAVMSGNYVQRGTPAICDRYSRAQSAVCNGVDLVIELPLPWSSSAAADFADGGMQIMNAIGFVDALSFGCEYDDLFITKRIIKLMQNDDLQTEIKDLISQGHAYPSAVHKALLNAGEEEAASYLSKPNNMLAFEYCKQLELTNVLPLPIKRIGCEHDSNDTVQEYASASWIRERIYNAYNSDLSLYNLYKVLPMPYSKCIIDDFNCGAAPIDLNKFSIAALSRLHTLSINDFASLPFVDHGFQHRLFSAVQHSVSLEQAYSLAKNKQVTHARIRRSLLQAALGMHKCPPMKKVPYLRILALNQQGRELLKKMQTTAQLPIIMRHADADKLDDYAMSVYNFNQQANDFYNLCLPTPQCCGFDKTRNVFIAK